VRQVGYWQEFGKLLRGSLIDFIGKYDDAMPTEA